MLRQAPNLNEGVAGATACANADLQPDTTNLPTISDATFCLLNAERASRGLTALKPDRQLQRAALAHGGDMVDHQYFAHEGRDGSQPAERIRATGYLSGGGAWRIGENLAWGTGDLASPRAIMAAWMNSPGHRANILQPQYRQIGFGVIAGNPNAKDGVRRHLRDRVRCRPGLRAARLAPERRPRRRQEAREEALRRPPPEGPHARPPRTHRARPAPPPAPPGRGPRRPRERRPPLPSARTLGRTGRPRHKEFRMESSDQPARVLVVANRTAATPALIAAVKERAERGPARFTLLVPNTSSGVERFADPEDHAETDAQNTLELALPLLEEAAGSEVTGMVGAPEPMDAIQDAVNLHGFDEIILSTLPKRVSRWLHLDLPSKLNVLGLPVTTVTASGRAERVA